MNLSPLKEEKGSGQSFYQNPEITNDLKLLYQKMLNNPNDKNVEKSFFVETVKFLATHNNCIWCRFPSLSIELLRFLILSSSSNKFTDWFKQQSKKCLSTCINCIISYYTERIEYFKRIEKMEIESKKKNQIKDEGKTKEDNEEEIETRDEKEESHKDKIPPSPPSLLERLNEAITKIDIERLKEIMNDHLANMNENVCNDQKILYMLYEVLIYPKHMLHEELSECLNEIFNLFISKGKMIKISKILPGLFYCSMHENKLIRNWSLEIIAQKNLEKDLFIESSFSIMDLIKLFLFIHGDFMEFCDNFLKCIKFITEEFITEEEICELILFLNEKSQSSGEMLQTLKILNELDKIKKLSEDAWIGIIKIMAFKIDIFSLALLKIFPNFKAMIQNMDDQIIYKILHEMTRIITDSKGGRIGTKKNLKVKSFLLFMIVCRDGRNDKNDSGNDNKIISSIIKVFTLTDSTFDRIEYLSDTLQILIKKFNIDYELTEQSLELIESIQMENFHHEESLNYPKLFKSISELIKKFKFEDLFTPSSRRLFNFFAKLSIDNLTIKCSEKEKEKIVDNDTSIAMQQIYIFEYLSCIESSDANKILWKLMVKMSLDPKAFLSILFEIVDQIASKLKTTQYLKVWDRLLEFLLQFSDSFQELEREKITVENFVQVKSISLNIVTIALNVIFDYFEFFKIYEKFIQCLSIFFCDLMTKDDFVINVNQNRITHQKHLKCLGNLAKFIPYFSNLQTRINYTIVIISLAMALKIPLVHLEDSLKNLKVEYEDDFKSLKFYLDQYNKAFGSNISLSFKSNLNSFSEGRGIKNSHENIREMVPVIKLRNPNILISPLANIKTSSLSSPFSQRGGEMGISKSGNGQWGNNFTFVDSNSSSINSSKILQLKDEISRERRAATSSMGMNHMTTTSSNNSSLKPTTFKSKGDSSNLTSTPENPKKIFQIREDKNEEIIIKRESNSDSEVEKEASDILNSLQKMHRQNASIPSSFTFGSDVNGNSNGGGNGISATTNIIRSVKLIDIESGKIESNKNPQSVPFEQNCKIKMEAEITKKLHLFILKLEFEKIMANVNFSFGHSKNSSGPPPPPSLTSLSLINNGNIVKTSIPNTFQSASHYISIFQYFFHLECQSRLYQTFIDNFPFDPSLFTKVIVREFAHIDNFQEITFNYEIGSSSQFIVEHDVLFIVIEDDSSTFNKSKDNKNGEMIGIVQKVSQSKIVGGGGMNLEIVCRTRKLKYQSSPSKISNFNSNSSVNVVFKIGMALKIFKFANIVTDLREYLALCNIQNLKLSLQIMHPQYIQPSNELISIKMGRIEKIMQVFGLNDSQALALATCLADPNGFILIQGPPGTGKTKTIEAIASAWISQIFKSQRDRLNGKKPKLLICSPSNTAIDEVAKRLKAGIIIPKENYSSSNSDTIKTINNSINNGNNSSMNSNGSTRTMPIKMPIKIVRIGSLEVVHDNVKDIFIDSIADNLFSSINSKVGDYLESQRKKVEQVKKDLEAAELAFQETKIKELKTSIWEIRENIRKNVKYLDDSKIQIKQKIIKEAQIVCSTLSGSGLDILSESEFDAIIIDEACQAIELSCLIPLQHQSPKCILVGDPNQLAPTIIGRDGNHSTVYEQSLFQRLQKSNPERVILLKTQYRMHPQISLFPSRYFYNSQLNDGHKMASMNQRPWHKIPLLGPYQFIDVALGRDEKREMKSSSSSLSSYSSSNSFKSTSYSSSSSSNSGSYSLMNLAEVITAINIICHLCTSSKDYNFSDKIGIITPYRQQKRLFQQEILKHFGKEALQSIEISTVDGFQGKEKEIIIFSCVRTGIESAGMGFLDDARRLNVALTRAKCSLFILGKASFLVSNHIWNALIQDAKERGLFFHYNNDEKIPFFPSRKITNLTRIKEAGNANKHDSSFPSSPIPASVPILSSLTDSAVKTSPIAIKVDDSITTPLMATLNDDIGIGKKRGDISSFMNHSHLQSLLTAASLDSSLNPENDEKGKLKEKEKEKEKENDSKKVKMTENPSFILPLSFNNSSNRNLDSVQSVSLASSSSSSFSINTDTNIINNQILGSCLAPSPNLTTLDKVLDKLDGK